MFHYMHMYEPDGENNMLTIRQLKEKAVTTLSVTLSGSSRDGTAGAFVKAHAQGCAHRGGLPVRPPAPCPAPPLPAVLSHPVSTGTRAGAAQTVLRF